jgi:hypothetical protein
MAFTRRDEKGLAPVEQGTMFDLVPGLGMMKSDRAILAAGILGTNAAGGADDADARASFHGNSPRIAGHPDKASINTD